MKTSACFPLFLSLSFFSACAAPPSATETEARPPEVKTEARGADPVDIPVRSEGRSQLLDKASKFERDGKMDLAIQLYSAAHAADASDPEVFTYLLALLVERERWGEAATAYDHAIAARPEDLDLALACGNLMAGAGRLPHACDAYRRATEIDPTSLEAHFRLGQIYLDLHEWSLATEALRGAVANDPTHYEAHSQLGGALIELERYESAVPVLAWAQGLAPEGDLSDARRRADVYLELERNEDAAKLYGELAQLQPDDAGLHAGRGQALFAMGHYDDAEAALERALECDPDHAGALLALSGLADATDDRATLVGMLPDGPLDEEERRALAAEHLRTGEELLSSGHLIDAYEDCQRAVLLDPRSASAHFALGRVYAALSLWSESADSLRNAIAIDPNHYFAHSQLGAALIQLERYELAVPVLAHAESLAEEGAADHTRLRATAYRELGRHDDSLAVLDALLGENPRDIELLLARGNALRALGRIDDARAAYLYLIEVDPGSADARDALQALSREEALRTARD